MITLHSGDLRVELAPDIGGCIASFRRGADHLMRPLSSQAREQRDVLGVASFPMMPYANRIAGNRFEFEGHVFEVQSNNGAERFNVHGSGWKSVWSGERLSEHAARLTLCHSARDDPYSYEATQLLDLSPDGLSIESAITNVGPRSMPFGIGHHPWFERDADVMLTFEATHFWLEGPEGIASDRISLAPEIDFARGASLPAGWRNNCYGGWNGLAEIRYPTRRFGLKIEADPIFQHLMLYADPEKPYFCLEPQSNASCAFNRKARRDDSLGIAILAPGESLSGMLRFTPFSL
jgi:aldose 1-epimerase